MGSKYFYSKRVYHPGLKKEKIIRGESQREVERKAMNQAALWDEQWSKKCESEKRRREREKKLRNQEESLAYAKELTFQAENQQESMDKILLDRVNSEPLKMSDFKDNKKYSIPEPIISGLKNFLAKPERTDSKYNPELSFLTKISKKKTQESKDMNDALYSSDVEKWEEDIELKRTHNNKMQEDFDKKHLEWEKNSDLFYKEQEEKNQEIERFFQDYEKGDSDAIIDYYTRFFESLSFPFEYECQVELEYTNENAIILDVILPTVEELPNLKKVTYTKTNDEFKESYQTEAYMKKKYENVIYQIVLLIINGIFKLDKTHNFVESVIVNGKINTVDKTTGKNIEPYILSVNAKKEDFLELNLNAIDPKAWFKNSKGISASALSNITPVAPIVVMSREDTRFIDGYNVSGELNESVNLAAIDWQDFENLIREVFGQEFNTNGGEVKITQASRDGGVDAVAFDPDPIRGGKIVIQAKRYTNTVGVSAVRDLYGTVMNEGATKGILVTTSNYGNDAYEFANGKPLTLMNGANLLYLLEKHGHRAKIDLQEAKALLSV